MFAISDNPFVVLGVTPRSTKAHIHDAVEDALLDAQSVEAERRLDVARQAIIAPNDRLRAELSYLLEMRPAEAKSALRSIKFEEWLNVANATVGLSKVNALAQAMATQPEGANAQEIFHEFLDNWARIGTEEIVTRINEDRSVAGVSEVRHSEVSRGLRELREFHAMRVLQGVERGGNLPKVLTDLITDKLIPTNRMGEPFPTAVLEAYQTRTAGALASAADRVLGCLQAYSKSGSEEDYSSFESELEKWDALAQPLQLASESKGADEAHSKDLYEKIRSAAIELANDEKRHHEALQITMLSSRVFAELPWSADALKKDAETLNEVIAHKTRNERLVPLVSAIRAAKADLSRTSRHLASHGFASNSPDPIGALWRAYANLLVTDTETEVRDLGANMVRSLSIALFNEREDALRARILTSQLIADQNWFSADLRKQIADDDAHLSYSVQLQLLTDAMKRDDWKKAKELSDDIRQITPPSDRFDLRKLDEIIDEKLRGKRAAKIVWSGIAAIALVVVVLNNNDSDGSGSNYEYAPTQDTVEAGPTFEPTVGEVVDSADGQDVQDAPDEEVAPPAYASGALTLPQLRYCQRQSERLDLARDLTTSEIQQSRFNAAINDFNLRCSSFRYDYSDMATVRSEIANIQSKLLSEAHDIVGAAAPAPVSDYTAPAINSDGTSDSLDGVVTDSGGDDLESTVPESGDNVLGEEQP